MSGPERILFLYLPTGGGHLSAAKALAAEIESRFSPGGVDLFLLDGLNPNSRFQRKIVEGGYQLSTLKLPFLWPLIYQVSTLWPIMRWHTWSMTAYSSRHIRQFIRKHRITRVVNLHFLLTRPLFRALDQLGRLDMPAMTVVLDPYTAHPLWFYKQFMPLAVFSRRVKHDSARFLARYAMHLGKRPELGTPVEVSPPILNPKFSRALAHDAAKSLKARYGFDPARRLILISGGGEGLPRGERYLEAIRSAGLDVDLAMVCGKNESMRNRCLEIAKAHRPSTQVTRIYGFVDFMYDLVNMADVVVTKAGPATIFECLMLEKPLVLTQRLYGQEQGNVDFVVSNKLGWFVPHPQDMTSLVQSLLDSPETFAEIRKRIRAKGLSNGTAHLADMILGLEPRPFSRRKLAASSTDPQK